MKFLAIVITTLSVSLTGCDSSQVATGAYLYVQSPWVNSPEGDERAANAKLLLLKSDHSFLTHDFVIREVGQNKLISRGDPHTLVLGTWRQEDGQITAMPSSVSRDIPIRGGATPECSVQKYKIESNGLRATGEVLLQLTHDASVANESEHRTFLAPAHKVHKCGA